MLQIVKKVYTVTIIITEGNDEFWEKLRNKSGCDEIVEEIKDALADRGFVEPDCHVCLTKFSKDYAS